MMVLKNLIPIFCFTQNAIERTCLVKADTVDAARHVDRPGRDAVDVLPLEPLLCVHGANGHGRRESGGNHDRDQVQGLQGDLAEGLAVEDLEVMHNAFNGGCQNEIINFIFLCFKHRIDYLASGH